MNTIVKDELALGKDQNYETHVRNDNLRNYT